MNMPQVSQCNVSECAYNIDDKCHALAITVGNTAHPRCDTYCESATKGGDLNSVGCVGACKISSCRYNKKLECQAPCITVGYGAGEVDCLTFQAR